MTERILRRLATLERSVAALQRLAGFAARVGGGQVLRGLQHVIDGTLPQLLDRTTSATNSRAFAQRIRARSTGNMTDGFGPSVVFSIQDDAGVSHDIAQIAAVRNGADTTGDLVLLTASTERVRINTSGIAIAGSAWNSTHLVMGSYHLWVDSSGRLRINSGAPGSDTAGVTVGSQS